jgi:zinc transporter ZupT
MGKITTQPYQKGRLRREFIHSNASPLSNLWKKFKEQWKTTTAFVAMCSQFYGGLMGQAIAAFKAALFQNSAAGGSGHPFHKAMLAAALAFFRLISLLRHEYYLTKISINYPP